MTVTSLRRNHVAKNVAAIIAWAVPALLTMGGVASAALYPNPVPPPADNRKAFFGVHDPGFVATPDIFGINNITLRNFSADTVKETGPATNPQGGRIFYFNYNRWEADLDAGRRVMVTWWPKYLTLAQINNDNPTVLADIHAAAQAVADDGRPILIRWMHEMNGSWFHYGGQANAVAYVAAWKKIFTIFMNKKSTITGLTPRNAAFVWCPSAGIANAAGSGNTQFGLFYPGKDYVHWIAADGYNTGVPQSRNWELLATIFDPWLNWIDANPTRTSDIPLMIGETGCDEPTAAEASAGESKAAWVNNAIYALRNNPKWLKSSGNPRIRAFVHQQYADDDLGDWRADSSLAAQQAYQSNFISNTMWLRR